MTKTFESPAPPADAKPHEFKVAVYRLREGLDPSDVDTSEDGFDASSYDRVEETFHAKPFVSGGLLAQLDRMAGRNAGDNARSGDAVYDFYDGALVKADVRRFRDLIESPRVYVHGSVLSDIAVWLYEVYAERPTR